MQKTIIGRSNEIYYDINKKIIGRIPTASNMKEYGSDNSLYFGQVTEPKIKNIIFKILDITDLSEFVTKKYYMKFYEDDIEIERNINKEGQVQFKIVGNGKMYGLYKKYEKIIGTKITFKKIVILLNFEKNTIFFKSLDNTDDESQFELEKATQEISQIIEEVKNNKYNIDIDGYIETKLAVRNNYIQREFRKKLLETFERKCAICSINKEEILIASHILPYSKCPGVNEMIDCNNGLLLCANHDILFDKGLITFNYKTGNIIISKQIDKKMYIPLNISEKIMLDKKYLTKKRRQFLATHKIK